MGNYLANNACDFRRKNYKTTRLFCEFGFWGGIGSLLGVSGNYYDFKYSKSSKDADIEAIENDWGVVGNDIEWAFKNK